MSAQPAPAYGPIVAMRIRFLPEVPAGAAALMEFKDPYTRFAVPDYLDMEQLPPPGAGPEPMDEMHFLFIAAGIAVPYETQTRAAAWMAKPGDPGAEPTVEMIVRSDRVLWRPGRAMVQGAPEHKDEILQGLLFFSFHEAELRKLEREIEAAWADAERDTRLTHGVTDDDLPSIPRVNEMTRRATAWRIAITRITRHLEKPALSLPGPARRLAAELAVQYETSDRIKSANDRIEVHNDLYELANDRLLEYSYYRGEYKLELWIIIILVLELIAFAADIFVNYFFI